MGEDKIMSTALALISSSRALAIGGLAANVVGTLFSGFSQQKAAEQEAADLEFQAQLQKEEAQEEAERLDKKNRKFLAHQSLMFRGVTLGGSPLLMLSETREESAKESDAVRKRGFATSQFTLAKAARTRSSGRGAFLGSIFSAVGTGALGARDIFS